MLLDVAQLRLRRPIHNKHSEYLRFATLATKPGEICGLGQSHALEERFGFDEVSKLGIPHLVGEANSLPPLGLAQ